MTSQELQRIWGGKRYIRPLISSKTPDSKRLLYSFNIIHMKTPILLAALGGALLLMPTPHAKTDEYRDLYADTWAATDALGRVLPMGGEVRPPQEDKFVGIFYFVWQGFHGKDENGKNPLYDMTKIIAANPENPQWGPKGAFHWWGEPEVGYYRATDPWVARRNLRLLAAAGVDCLFVDVTNAFTYPDEMKVLFETAQEMRAQGNPTPQIAFLLNTRVADVTKQLWEAYYKDDKYSELWFRWEGKPIILADPDSKDSDGNAMPDEILNFFTWRKSWFETRPNGWFGDGKGKWAWRDKTPQKPGLSFDGKVEQVAVGVASHPIGENIGRSYANGKAVETDKYDMTTTYGQGIQFQEQWDSALQTDPPLIFVTGWNEWVAQRQTATAGQVGAVNLAGRKMKFEGDTFFVDVYNAEFSRDADMMKGGYTDNYYYQLAANIRQYKGARPVPVAGVEQTIAIDGDFAPWRQIWPEFRDSVGDTMHRDFDGWGDNHYTNTTGRNDITTAKVARDAGNVTFYAKTHAPLSPRTDARWMMLFINSDQNGATGWHGYDLRVGAVNDALSSPSIERWKNGAWEKIGSAKLAYAGNELELSLPRNLIARNAATAPGSPLNFDFKWVDNADPDDINDWFLSGDVAPERRFNYRYKTD